MWFAFGLSIQMLIIDSETDGTVGFFDRYKLVAPFYDGTNINRFHDAPSNITINYGFDSLSPVVR